MKKLLPLLIPQFVYTLVLAVGFLLPDDGSRQPRMLLDLDVPDCGIVDLAGADVIAEYDEKYFVYGDTLICRQALGANEWLLARNGSLWRAGWNDRTTQRRLTHGMPFLPGDAMSPSCTDTLTVSYLDFPSESRPVYSVTAAGSGCSFVTACGDTLICPTCVREDWTEILPDGSELHRTSRRWHEHGHAMATVCCETWRAGSLTWTVTSVPSPHENGQQRKAQRRNDDIETAVPAGSYVRVYDLQGRLMLSGYSATTDTDNLPGGVYIIERVSEGVSSVTKIWVK